MAEKPERIPRYPELVKPEFKSTIPPHLVDMLSPQEKYMVESLSRMEAQNEWLINAALEANRGTRETDVRLQTVEDWKSMITYKGSVVIALALILVPLIIERIVGSIWPHKP